MAGTWTVYASERTRGWVWGGVLLGAACVAKVPLFLFLPGTLLLLPRPFWRPAFSVAAGAAIPLVAFAVMNVHLFGSPIVTSYDRIAALAPDGQPTVYSQRSSFDLPIEEGIRGQLFDREHGLLTTSPVTLLALVGLPFCFVRRPRLSAQLVITSIALFFLFSTYDQWDASHYGNRFLMPLIASFVVPLAAAFDRLTGHVVALPRPDLA
jgi:hypothetical protein